MHLLRMWHPIIIWVQFSFTLVVVKIVKNFLNASSFMEMDSFARMICSVLFVLVIIIEGSNFRSSIRNDHMLTTGLNLVLA